MTINLLVSHEMNPVPDDIKVIENYGKLTLFRDLNHPPEMYYTGEHMIVSGTEEAMKNWLRKFDGVWVGNGIPMLEHFTIMHVGE